MQFLVFQHVPHEHPGLIADFAKKHNILLDVIELWKPYKMPSLSSYSALIVMGGPMGVYDGNEVFPSKEEELRIIKNAVGTIPVLGFCLGSQLLAHALGAAVRPNIQNGRHEKEIGYYNITLTPVGQNSPLFKGFSKTTKVLQWHGDAFDLPNDATLLATSQICKHQVFSYKNAYGLLFHFEFTPEMVAKQISIDTEWIHKDFKMNEKQLIQQAKDYEALMKKQSTLLLNNFLSIVKNKS